MLEPDGKPDQLRRQTAGALLFLRKLGVAGAGRMEI
jgi:hypothetical protein